MPNAAMHRLVSLQKTLQDQRVLSVYFSARANDPSRRRAWKTSIKAALRRQARALDDSNADAAERDEFVRARAAIESLDLPDAGHSDGIACFATAGGVQRVERLPFATETTVVWGHGVAVAPWVRAVKQHRPVVVAVVDGKFGHLYQYRDERLTHLETVKVEPHLREPTHMSARVTPRLHPGTRGVAGQDQAQREWSAATERMVRRLAQQVAHHAGDDAWVVIGGRPDVLHRAVAALPKLVQQRTGQAPDISVQSPPHDLARAARDGAATLRDDADAEALQRLADSGDERHAAALGENAARRALDRARVARLFVSMRFLAARGADAERVVRAALAQGADVEAVSGPAARALDGMGGIAARLRYADRAASE